MSEDLSHLLNLPGAIVATWCSFCKKREANGTVKFDLAPGMPVNLYICNFCVAQAKSEGFEIDLTDSQDLS